MSIVSDTLRDQTLADKVSALVRHGHLDRGAPAYGVALAAIDLGYDRLTRAQKRLYDRIIAPAVSALDSNTLPERAPAMAPASTSRTEKRADDAATAWMPIREAPEEIDVQLATMVGGEPSALAFACRRENRTWVNSATRKPIFIRPSHWRHWAG